MRRALLLVTAFGTLVEGVLIAGSLLIMSAVIGAYSMSLNGSDPSSARLALWVLAGVVGLGFIGVAVLLAMMARSTRPRPGAVVRHRQQRGVIIAAASVQWILAVLAGILVGGWVFAFALAMCGLFMGVLFAEPERPVVTPAPR